MSNQFYDPAQLNEKLRNMILKGDTSELPDFIREVLMQSVANPLTQAILAPLAQSLAAPLSQYFSSSKWQSFKGSSTVREEKGFDNSNRLDPQLFEIHGFVVVRTPIPEDVDEKTIRVLITSSHITIKGDPSGNEHILPLPQGTKKEGASAAFKDRILEIRIPREIEHETSEEVSIQYL